MATRYRLPFAILFMLFTCCWTFPAMGQAETLLGGNVSYGGFGGPVLRVSVLDGEAALLTGGRGGWIINLASGDAIVLGGGGYGVVTDVRAGGLLSNRGRPLYLNLGYGGFIFEYVNRTNDLVHLSAEALVGGGGANYRDRNYNEFEDSDAFFAFEPGLSVMLNVASFFRVGAGVSYRYFYGVDLEAFSDADLSGPSGVLTFKFGRF